MSLRGQQVELTSAQLEQAADYWREGFWEECENAVSVMASEPGTVRAKMCERRAVVTAHRLLETASMARDVAAGIPHLGTYC